MVLDPLVEVRDRERILSAVETRPFACDVFKLVEEHQVLSFNLLSSF